MITDIFARRYADVPIRTQYFRDDRRFMTQAAVMIMDPLWVGQMSDMPSDTTEAALKGVHDVLALELGRQWLSERYWFSKRQFNGNEFTHTHTYTYANICRNFLVKVPPDMTLGDEWVKERLSLIELAFRTRWKWLSYANENLESEVMKAKQSNAIGRGRMAIPGNREDGIRARNARLNAAFNDLMSDLNERLRLALYKLTYHNGFIQLSEDETINRQIADPFWQLLRQPAWLSVDEQFKEALDRRDNGDRTAAFHAVCALESAIKIISDLKGWTTGKENGAASYIDNLNSKANGRFIEPWEGEMLKSMFGDVRNPFAHGSGRAPMPKLSPQQTDWAIDTAMSWVRNLIRRL
jgi:hypothetical protein